MKRFCLALLSALPFLCALVVFAQEVQVLPATQDARYTQIPDKNTGEPVPAAVPILTGFENPVEDGEARFAELTAQGKEVFPQKDAQGNILQETVVTDDGKLLSRVVAVATVEETGEVVDRQYFYTEQARDEPFTEHEMRVRAGEEKLEQAMQPYLMQALAEGKVMPFILMGEGKDNAEFQALTGITAEQFAQVKALGETLEQGIDQDALNYRAYQTDDPAELAAIAGELATQFHGTLDKLDTALHEILTPEQMLRLRELELQAAESIETMLDENVFDFGAYEALELDADQKTQLDAIRDEFLAKQTELAAQLARGGLSGEDEEALQEKLRSNTARAKARILALLTPAQAAKMERLLANRPAFAKNLFGMEDLAGEESDGDEENLDWVHSWKPGDPLPESAEIAPRQGTGVFPRISGQP